MLGCPAASKSESVALLLLALVVALVLVWFVFIGVSGVLAGKAKRPDRHRRAARALGSG